MTPADHQRATLTTRRPPSRCPITGRSNASGRTWICPEQPTDEELAALNPELAEALFGTPKRPFSVSLEFPPFDGPDYARALEMARASAEYREIGAGRAIRHRARFYPEDRRQAARSVRDRRPLRCDRRADRRSAGPVRARAVAAAVLVPDPMMRPSTVRLQACRRVRSCQSSLTSSAICCARGRAEEARSGIQHVLHRAAAASAVGDARPCRGDGQAMGSRPHSRAPRSVPVRDAPVALSVVHRALGPGAARAGGRTPRTVRAAAGETGRAGVPGRQRRKVAARHRVQGSGARNGQAPRALRHVDGGAAQTGDEVVPFHKFAALVKSQVSKLRQSGSRKWRSG